MPRNCQKVGSEVRLHTTSRRGQQATILRGAPRDLSKRNSDSRLAVMRMFCRLLYLHSQHRRAMSPDEEKTGRILRDDTTGWQRNKK